MNFIVCVVLTQNNGRYVRIIPVRHIFRFLNIIVLCALAPYSFEVAAQGANPGANGKGRLFVNADAEASVEAGVKAVRINFGLLRSGRLQFDLLDGLSVDGVRDRDLAMGPGRRAWVGHVNGSSGDRIVLGQSGDALTGIINVGDRKFQLFYIAQGLHGIREIGRSQPFPGAAPIAVAPSSEDTGGAGSTSEPQTAGDGNTVIDVIVGYTVASKNLWGGTSGIEALIVTAVAETNDAYANSNIPVTMQLVHTMELVGAEGANESDDLSAFRSTTDGKWDEIHAARTTYGADFAVLIEEMPIYCGIAYVMTTASDSFKTSAFSAVDSGCATGYFSFGHEIGHNQGSNHNPGDGGSRVYTFSQGHRDPGEVFRTIMAYNCDGNCPRVQHFSNPNVTYAQTGLPTGVTNVSDNAQSITLTAPTAAAWYSAATPVTAPLAPTVLSASATSDSTIYLDWLDNSDNESQFLVERSTDNINFTQIATTAPDDNDYDDSGLSAATIYYYRVFAYNSGGTSAPTNTASAETDPAPAYVDQYATGEQAVHGLLSGTYLATQAADDDNQRISERHSGGKPQNRYTWLEHRWTFSVAAGTAVSAHIDATANLTSGESLQFAYSTDNSNWTDLVAIHDNSDQNIVVPLSSNISGTVYLRVADEQRQSGLQTSSYVDVDFLMIRTENGSVSGTAPDAPTTLAVTGVTSSSISLSWIDNAGDETGFELERSTDGTNFSMVATIPANDESFTDIGLAASATYYYRLRAVNGSGNSAYSGPVSDTTLAPSGITLSASGTKVKGVHHGLLSWGGAAGDDVEIERNGLIVATTANDDFHDDNIGNKGSGSYGYRVCEIPPSSVCSDLVQVNF